MSDPSKLRPVSKAHPCPVCGGDHKCSTSPDGGLVLCGRRDGPEPGFDHLGPCKDPTWHKYRPGAGRFQAPSAKSQANPGSTPPRWQELADQFARDLDAARRADLADRLRLPVRALLRLPDLGWDARGGCWTVPECDAAGRAVGIGTRYPDGQKRFRPGGERGVVLTGGWADAGGPVFLVEGMSDALALAHCGLAAVGRPSNRGGGPILAELLRHHRPDRPLVVFGENDQKPDGSWPGKDGAEAVATVLRLALPGRQLVVALPPDGYKDVRDWVVDRLAGRDDPAAAEEVGRDIAAAVARQAKLAALTGTAARSGRRFKMPVPIGALAADPDRPTGWVWDGYLARGRVTLLSALPKCGKTTLIAHLLAALPAGGSFLGRPLLPGRVVVVSEEDDQEWADRRDALGLDPAAVRVLTRPFFGKPPADDWLGFLAALIDHLLGDPADLVVLDTLADLWPVRDENSATDVQAAMQPLRRLADGRAVLCVHHLRKSDGAEGTGARGSGALAGFVDILMELRRVKDGPHGEDGPEREIKAVGRLAGIPKEWVVALDPKANRYAVLGDRTAAVVAEGREARRKQAREDREDELREAVLNALSADGDGLTVEEVWASLPAVGRPGVGAVRDFLAHGSRLGVLWSRSGGVKGRPWRYRRLRMTGTLLPDHEEIIAAIRH